ncbi:hypothetical protein [Pseudogemmobacter sp. W21_MBD1_M6]|uniref:hypothetical protein n=1 Tax=Pseudogemmobacter sp. W21_MBD1_M6 TaxID=3240271 RepID=UPI003F9803D3
MAQFARNKQNGHERTVRFLNDLPRLHDLHLPEHASMATGFTAGPAKQWRTVRIRPEVLGIVEGLQDRATLNTGVELSISEVLAALLIEGLPDIAEAAHGPFRSR